MVTPSVGQCGPHRSSHSGHPFPTAISGSPGTYLSDAILFVFACKHLNGVKRQLSQIYGFATWDLNVKVISYWFYPKCHRRAHLVDHQRHTMPTGAGSHDAGLLLFTDRNKHHVNTRHLDKVDKYFLSLCIVFHSVLWEYLRSEISSVTQGQLALAPKGMCHGLATSNCANTTHTTPDTLKCYNIYSYWSMMSFCISGNSLVKNEHQNYFQHVLSYQKCMNNNWIIWL